MRQFSVTEVELDGKHSLEILFVDSGSVGHVGSRCHEKLINYDGRDECANGKDEF